MNMKTIHRLHAHTRPTSPARHTAGTRFLTKTLPTLAMSLFVFLSAITSLRATDATVIAVAAGDSWNKDSVSAYLTSDGKLWVMGFTPWQFYPSGGNTPVQVASNVKAVAVSGDHSLFVTNDGSLYATGNNKYGQLGVGDTTDRLRPVKVDTGGLRVKAVAVGGEQSSAYSLYITDDGGLYAMGANTSGQLGDGTNIWRDMPVRTLYSDGTPHGGVIDVAAGGSYSLFLKNDGSLWGMGSNYYGQLGMRTKINRQLWQGNEAATLAASEALIVRNHFGNPASRSMQGA